ncbi:unnamed protein product, partial [Ascophyllum nodosum]
VEAGTLTTVVASASAYDTRPGGESGDVGCGDDGCLPSLIRDNVTTDGESRWSCSEKIVPDGGQCTIVFNLDQPFYVAYVHVAFWNEDERTLQLQVIKTNGEDSGTISAYPGSTFPSSTIDEDGGNVISLTLVNAEEDDWINILEVKERWT